MMFGIEQQTHRMEEFGDDSCEFKSSHNVRLSSKIGPGMFPEQIGLEMVGTSSEEITLYVRGSDPRYDDNAMLVSERVFDCCIAPAVKEYNEHFKSEEDTETHSNIIRGIIE